MIKLTTPISDQDIKALKVGKKVLLSGTIYTARDQAHARLIKEKKILFDLKGAVIYYVGPSPKRAGFPIGSSGPTSSYRMDMIGKGDRSEEFRQEMIKNNAVYLITTGGTGALISSKILKSELLMYEDLDAEAIYKLEVKDFPCFVAYDVYGNNIFKDHYNE